MVLLTATAATGCGGSSTGTWLPNAEHGPVMATQLELGSITVRKVLIQEPRTGQAYSEGDIARMGLELVNEGPDTDVLLGVSTPIARETRMFLDFRPPEGADRPTAVDRIPVAPAASGTPEVVRAFVQLRDLRTAAREGQTYPVTFRFRNAGPMQAMVPVDIPQGP